MIGHGAPGGNDFEGQGLYEIYSGGPDGAELDVFKSG